jgi:hypothetical protein
LAIVATTRWRQCRELGDEIMSQFYISSENPEADLRRCQDSQKFRTWLVITGATERGEIELFEGIVQLIEDNGESAPTGRRWRITVREP